MKRQRVLIVLVVTSGSRCQQLYSYCMYICTPSCPNEKRCAVYQRDAKVVVCIYGGSTMNICAEYICRMPRVP